ncbi:MAG: LysR family transcriptional regulator [Aquabacterium sp.]
MTRQFEHMADVELFCLAAESGGFTSAAQQAGLTPGAVSRAVARLEARLGVQLFVRSTRQVRLTDAGLLYLDQCRQAFTQIADAERLLGGQQVQPTGVVRVSMPSAYGQFRILPLIASFKARYPEVDLVINLFNRNVDFGEEPYDLVIRARPPADSRLVARKLEEGELIIVGAPSYLERAGTPQTLEDLVGHECIQFELPSSGRRIPWSFMADGEPVEWATQGSITCSDDFIGGVQLARHGAGLYQSYRFMAADALACGELVEVLQPFGGRSRPFSVLYPHGRHLPLRVRVFIDHLLQELPRLQPA